MSHDHTDESIESLAEFHQAHHRSAAPVQKVANRLTRAMSRPGVIAIIFGLIALWPIGNGVAARMGFRPFEQFPFPALELVATVSALLVALLILTTQRHQDELADQRAQLTLQIALLSEKKIAKVIRQLELQRRENPMLPTRVDAEADAMAKPSDPRDSLDRIKAAHQTE
jgi:uncharacterized membrane protein